MDILTNPPHHALHQQHPSPDHFETGGLRKRQRLSHLSSGDDAAPARFAPFGGSIVDAPNAGRLPLGESSGNVQQQNAQGFAHNRDVVFGSQSALALCPSRSTANNSATSTPTLSPLSTIDGNHHQPTAATGPVCGPNHPQPWTLELADDATRRNSFGARRGNSQHLHLDFANGPCRSLYGVPGGSGVPTSRKGTPTVGARPVSYNPLYNNAGFRAYRAKQAEKAIDGREEQKWPEWLEQAFCDALLTIPAMGRHKYQMMKRPAPSSNGGSSGSVENSSGSSTSNSNDQAGRNMLVSEWLWLVYLDTLPIGSELPIREWGVQVVNKKTGESETKTMHHAMVRDRKKVSSHIQVAKKFFQDHPMQHFVFVTEEKRANGRAEEEERESFKDNTVLRALRESRLPDERYNYRYWAYLLAADKRVQIRPKECWILVAATSVNFVSNSSSKTSSLSCDRGQHHNQNGTGKSTSNSFHAYHVNTGERLDERRFPHLDKNLKREDWPRNGANIKGCMLHEYTRAMAQMPSTSIRNLRLDWEDDFPELHEPLANALADGVKDIMHCNATLNISETTQFPAGAELNSCIEVSIDQPELVGHDWKVVTRLCRPQELCRDRSAGSDPFFSIETKAVGHDGNCDGVSLSAGGNCNCVAARQKNELMVPYPAAELAIMLSRLASFPPHAYVGFEPSPEELAAEAGHKKRGRKSNTGTSKTTSHASKKPTTTTARPKGGDDGGSLDDGTNAPSPEDAVTQMSLIGQVAMMQELWSQEPPSAATTPGQQRPWTRRCLLLWNFETLYSIDEARFTAAHKYPIKRQAAGSMSWRFMSAIDPSDAIHLQQSLIGGDEAAAQIAAVAQSVSANAVYTPSEPVILGSSPAPGVANVSASMIVPSSTPVSTNGSSSRLAAFHRDQIMSPSPSFQQHMSASMAENYAATASAWSGSAGIIASNGQAYAASYQHHHHHHHPPPQPPAAMHASPSVAYGQRGGTPLFRGLMEDLRHGGGSPGSGLATPPPTAGLASMAPGSSAPLSQNMSSGSLAPSLSFMSTASTADSCPESVVVVVDPFLASGTTFDGYHQEVVVPDGWEPVHAGTAYGIHNLSSSGWTVTPGSNVGGAGPAASSFNGHLCWASPSSHHGLPRQPQQHQHWNTPAVSTPGSTILDLGPGAAEYSQADGCLSSQHWRQQQHQAVSSQPSPSHPPSPHAAVVQGQDGDTIGDPGTDVTTPRNQQHPLVTSISGTISRKRQREDEGDERGHRVDAAVTGELACDHNQDDAWTLVDV